MKKLILGICVLLITFMFNIQSNCQSVVEGNWRVNFKNGEEEASVTLVDLKVAREIKFKQVSGKKAVKTIAEVTREDGSEEEIQISPSSNEVSVGAIKKATLKVENQTNEDNEVIGTWTLLESHSPIDENQSWSTGILGLGQKSNILPIKQSNQSEICVLEQTTGKAAQISVIYYLGKSKNELTVSAPNNSILVDADKIQIKVKNKFNGDNTIGGTVKRYKS